MSKSSKKRRSAAEWSSLIADWRSSGETLERYAQVGGLNAGTMRWWRTRLARRGRGGALARVDGGAQEPASTAAFARVRVTQPGREAGHLEVLSRGGHIVRVVGEVDAARLRTLLGVLDVC